jgi:hypothetical protein
LEQGCFLKGPDDSQFYLIDSIWLSAANVAFAGDLLIPWITSKIRIPVGTGILAMCVLMIALPNDLMLARWTAGVTATLLVLDVVRAEVLSGAMVGLPCLGD